MNPFSGLLKRRRAARIEQQAEVMLAAQMLSKRIGLAPPSGNWTTIFDWNTGTWQQDSSIELDTVLTFAAVFACIRLIASDIGKLRIRLLQQQSSGIWQETTNPAYTPVLRKPNATQIRIKFVEQWVQSKLQHGNTYVLKYRDNRGVVTGLRVLDPSRVQVLVSESGLVYYKLLTDRLPDIQEDILAPASDIIHDVHMTPEHPLIGVSPIGACGLAATQGIKMQTTSKNTFANSGRPAGILTAPGAIADATATRLQTAWDTNFGGSNIGKKTAVLGDGLKYESVSVSPVDAQFIEQLNWTGQDVCRAFGVPAYKIGIGEMPAYNNIEALDQAYYSQTLQEFIECIESLLDEGLELKSGYRTEFDIDQLLRMDSMTRAKVDKELISAGVKSPNEVRHRFNLPPVDGGDTPYLQQQHFSLAALAKRDAKDDPFGTAKASPAEPPQEADDSAEQMRVALIEELRNVA